jgi:hypothetical protein
MSIAKIKSCSVIVGIISIILLVAPSAFGEWVANYSFVGISNGVPAVGGYYTGPGVVGSGTYWNCITNNYTNASLVIITNTSALADDGSTSLTNTFVVQMPNMNIYGTANYLLDSYVQASPSNTSYSFSFTNLPNGTYDLVLFGINGEFPHGSRGSTFTVNGQNRTATNSLVTDNRVFVENGNFVKFAGVSVTNKSLAGTYMWNSSFQKGGYFNGLQLQYKDARPTVSTPAPPLTKILQGLSAQFSATVSGFPAPVMFWQFNTVSNGGTWVNVTNSVTLSGAGSNVLSLSNIQSSRAGYYRLVATNVYGMATSAPPARLMVYTNTSANYFVSTNGSDTNDGKFWASAWKTIKRGVNGRVPGDVVNLAGGQTFSETVIITNAVGAIGLPVTLTSDPMNPATIRQVGTSYGIRVYNNDNVTMQNLLVSGLGGTNIFKSGTGVGIVVDGSNNLGGHTLSNLTVTGFNDGIKAEAWSTNALLHDVLIVNCQGNYNYDGGGTWAPKLGGVSNVIVRDCQFNYNFGDPTYYKHTGSGFAFGFTVDGLMEHCITHDNGGWGTNVNEGPVGIWFYDSKRITIQYCESYNNKSQGADGDGFDIDEGNQDSIIQYCYAHDNWGAGYLLCSGLPGWSNNIVRYCVSENDGSFDEYAGIHLWINPSTGGELLNGKIYNNTVYSAIGPAFSYKIGTTTSVSGMTVRNNLFITASNQPHLISSSYSSPAASQVLFQGNDYWSFASTNAVMFRFGNNTFYYYTNLASWRAGFPGQETLNSTNVGFNVDPVLYNPGGGGTIGNTYAFTNLTAYRLQASSPMIGTGLDLDLLFGINPGTNDFYGRAIPQTGGFDLGAIEYVPKAIGTVTLGNLSQTYSGNAKSATATTTPSGLIVNLTYNGSANAPTNAGSYTVVGTINDVNYQGSATNTLVIGKSAGTVTLGNLNQTYNGSAKSATATTTPSGLTVNLTYNGSANAPTNAGSYTVAGTINDVNYQGSMTNTLVIGKATATVSLGSLSQTYNGSARVATATTTPSGLTVNLTYNGSANAPTNAGSYTVVGTINDVNYQGSATNTLVIGKATGMVTLGSLSQTYDGSAKSATATTTPSGLTVNLTYNGSANAPTNASSYTVVGTINDLNYQGSATNTLLINNPTATVTPAILSALQGSAVNFTVAAAGYPISYQWQSGPATNSAFTNLTNTGNISGANTSLLIVSNLALSQAGYYRIIVTYSFGSVTSSVANLNVTPATNLWTLNFDFDSNIGGIIGTYTNAGVIGTGGNYWNSIAISGTNASGTNAFTDDGTINVGAVFVLQYQGHWSAPGSPVNMLLDDYLFNKTNNPVAETPFAITNLPNGIYNVVLYAEQGSLATASTTFYLTNTGTAQSCTNGASTDTAFVQGENYVRFPVVWVTNGTIAGTWSYNAPQSGVFSGAQLQYLGSGGLPTISSVTPASQSALQGSAVNFSVSAGGSQIGYQWQSGSATNGTFTSLTNAGNVGGVNTSVLTITNLALSQAGYYRVVVTNSLGLAISRSVNLSVTPATNLWTVNFDFDSNAGGVVGTSTNAGVIGSAGNYWNSVTLAGTSATNATARSDDGVTNRSIALSLQFQGHWTAPGSPVNKLLDDYAFNKTNNPVASQPFAITNLPNGIYNVVLYAEQGATATASTTFYLTNTGTAQSCTNGVSADTVFVQGENCVRFPVVWVTNKVITGIWSYNTPKQAVFSGLQLQYLGSGGGAAPSGAQSLAVFLTAQATVSADAPANQAVFAAYARVPLQATVTPNGNNITSVQFLLADGTVIAQGALSGMPNVYTNSWTPAVCNTSYSIAAQALYGGTAVTSSTRNITVSPVVPPAFGQVKIGAAGFCFNIAAANAGGQPYTILSSTNLVAPMSAWITNEQGVIGVDGSINYTSPSPLKANNYFKIRVP